MFNIFFNPNYAKTDKVFLTRNLKYSKFLDLINLVSYKLKIPVSDNFIFSGPNKRFNNLLHTFNKKEYSYNAEKYNNYYFVHFDDYSEKILKKMINQESFRLKKFIIGPLYNPQYQRVLYDYVSRYKNIKMLVASEPAYIQARTLFTKLNNSQIIISPSGVISEKVLINNSTITNRDDSCVVYVKNRTKGDLDFVINFLKQNGINFKIFEYGKYKNKDLIKSSKKSKFGILINRTESQGFATQEMLSCNLPLYVWEDSNSNSDALSKFYGTSGLKGTSVPYWSKDCGLIIQNKSEFIENFNLFVNNLESYEPYLYIKKNLTYEIANKRMNEYFESENMIWN